MTETHWIDLNEDTSFESVSRTCVNFQERLGEKEAKSEYGTGYRCNIYWSISSSPYRREDVSICFPTDRNLANLIAGQ